MYSAACVRHCDPAFTLYYQTCFNVKFYVFKNLVLEYIYVAIRQKQFNPLNAQLKSHLPFASTGRSSLFVHVNRIRFNILKPTAYVMHQQFNIQQLNVLPTLYLCVLYLSENKQRLVPLTA